MAVRTSHILLFLAVLSHGCDISVWATPCSCKCNEEFRRAAPFLSVFQKIPLVSSLLPAETLVPAAQSNPAQLGRLSQRVQLDGPPELLDTDTMDLASLPEDLLLPVSPELEAILKRPDARFVHLDDTAMDGLDDFAPVPRFRRQRTRRNYGLGFDSPYSAPEHE